MPTNDQPNIPNLTAYKTGQSTADRWQEHVRAVFNAWARYVGKAIEDLQTAYSSTGFPGPSGPPGGTGSSTAGPVGPPGPPGSASAVVFRVAPTVDYWESTDFGFNPVGGVDSLGNVISQIQITTTGWPVVMGFGPPGQPTTTISYRNGEPMPPDNVDFPGIISRYDIVDPPIDEQVMNLLIYVRVVNIATGEQLDVTLANYRQSSLAGLSGAAYPELSTIWRLPAATYQFTLLAGILSVPPPHPCHIIARRVAFYVMEL